MKPDTILLFVFAFMLSVFSHPPAQCQIAHTGTQAALIDIDVIHLIPEIYSVKLITGKITYISKPGIVR